MSTLLLAGGGTAGHVNPLLATADAARAAHPEADILVLGTNEGLEARLVPARGYELATIPKLPFPRRPNADALRFPGELRRAVRQVRALLHEHNVDAVVGFGGYAAAPAYLAARGQVPLVVHEANAKPGLANRLGARWAAHTAVAFQNTPLRGAEWIGMPLRREIAHLDRAATRPEALRAFGLQDARPTLLVTGGSLGAKRINETIRGLGPEIIAAGWQLIHVVGRLSPFDDPLLAHYHVIEYCDRMDLAFAAADFVVSRAGASTVSELAAVGLPTLFVPYAVGNGEQAQNIATLIDAGGAVTVSDGEFTPERAREVLLPLLRDTEARARMARGAHDMGRRDAAEALVALTDDAIARRQRHDSPR